MSSSTGRLLLLAGVLLGAVSEAGAQIVAPAGRTLFNRNVMVRSFVRLDEFDEGVPGLRVRRIVNAYALVWGAYPGLDLTFVAPVVVLDRRVPGAPARESTTAGTGDGAVFARYDWIRRNVPAGFTRLAPEVGVKLPTGSAFGSGSTDFSGALVFSHVRDRRWLVVDAQLHYNRAGDGGVRHGNRWQYDVAYLYRIFPRESPDAPGALLVLELNGESSERSRIDGAEIPGTGGDLLFFSPGVEFFLSRRLVLEAAVPVRIHEALNGSQVRPDWSLLVGFRWLL